MPVSTCIRSFRSRSSVCAALILAELPTETHEAVAIYAALSDTEANRAALSRLLAASTTYFETAKYALTCEETRSLQAAIVAAGGYGYDRYPAVEDYDLWSRLAKSGVRFANLPDPLLKYRLHPGGMKSTRLTGILRGTLDVKQRYWRSQLGLRGHVRMMLERLLLCVPPAITYQLFTWTALRRQA